MKILIFQHLACETAGIFTELWINDGHSLHVIALDEGDQIPALDTYDLLAVMGGPMDVWQEAEHPWLIPEKAAIKHWVQTLNRPYFGICLGHQLLAVALGGEAYPMQTPEVDLTQITQTGAGRSDPIFAQLPAKMTTLQWHGVEVTTLPPDTVVLASNPACAVQAMRVGRHAYGVQYHLEILPSTVADWQAIPAYRTALHAAIGAEAAEELESKVAPHLPEFRRIAKQINAGLKTLVGSDANAKHDPKERMR
ncbi:MAG: type 1 glutamine amidotransferase [Cypionkella sp.]|uniref:type 1 glutamine amidotransferase n=1 Tax=Cypionkella sp. TaxID=2811411 RepID=UPI002ABC5A83|nr:type 1 glutamine amidotransferase [Cypionkella sp.]MDZ4311568.1 type 1 glutamine amidotransferase [Cypionkella sp.]